MTRGSRDHFSLPAKRMVVRLSHATRQIVTPDVTGSEVQEFMRRETGRAQRCLKPARCRPPKGKTTPCQGRMKQLLATETCKLSTQSKRNNIKEE
ncbi:hypothetical protein EYF80_009652 [Liparis tanakae]|uniref:Uncharacterized protein n=1 Tax=Liparis tanakae TaxID=230148 RepID=A0A4Z2IQ64_9TELE|nr:hypothetical protein EYF80_009652 [Liparis tanakae]